MSYYQSDEKVRRPAMLEWLVVILSIMVIALVLRNLFGFFAADRRELNDPGYKPRPITARGDLADDENSTISLFREVSPAVVFITTANVRRDRFSFNLMEIPSGTGSGFIYDKQGHIVTNYHVIRNADTATVTLHDQSTWPARLVGVEPDKDLAVLRVDIPDGQLRPILIGSSSDLQVGQKVFAIGNPFGLDQTLTTGVISGLGREITSLTRRKISGAIQTDAAINPGNSGGPLLDSAGRLVGVNTAIYSPSGAYAGIGFAVPVDTVNRVVPELIRYGRVARPVLGINPDDRVLKRMGIDGVLILGVFPGSGAAEAGLRATRYDDSGKVQLGDIIVAINDQPIDSVEDLLDALEEQSIGETASVTIVRNNRRESVDVRLQGQ